MIYTVSLFLYIIYHILNIIRTIYIIHHIKPMLSMSSSPWIIIAFVYNHHSCLRFLIVIIIVINNIILLDSSFYFI